MKPRSLLIVLGFAVIAAGVILLGGSKPSYTIKAELINAGGLRKNSSVKIGGVPAGTVRELEVTKDDHAIATLEIEDSAAPIGKGAAVNIRPTDLLGERYAEIKGGDSSQPMDSGAVIPASRTAQPVELDDILNMLDVDTRTRLGLLVNEAGVALAGRGADFNKLLAQLPPSLQDTTKLIAQVEKQTAAMKIGVKRADRVTALVNNRRSDMGELIKQASQALDVVAEKRAALGQTIQNAPGALANLRSTLANLDRASTELRPAAIDLKKTTGPLRETLAAIPAFTKDARPTLNKAKAVSPDITRLAKGATPTIKKIQPTARNLSVQLKDSGPILKQLDRRGFDDILNFVHNFNRGVKYRDGIGHLIGAHLQLGTEYINNAIDQFTVGQGTAVPNDKTPIRKTDKPTPQVAPSTNAPAAPPAEEKTPKQKIDDLLDKVLPGVTDATDKLGEDLKKGLGGTGDNLQKLVPGLLGGTKQGPASNAPPDGSDALRLFDYLMGQ